MLIVFALVIAFLSPYILLPIEQKWLYPYIFEELIKLLAICLIIFPHAYQKKNYLWAAVLVGVLFTVSESVLYLINFFSEGRLALFPIRLLITGALHSSTCVLIYFSARKNFFWLVVGFVAAVFIHFYFNQFISQF